jgi:hypothetical protein
VESIERLGARASRSPRGLGWVAVRDWQHGRRLMPVVRARATLVRRAWGGVALGLTHSLEGALRRVHRLLGGLDRALCELDRLLRHPDGALGEAAQHLSGVDELGG